MATQTVEFAAPTGMSLTAKLSVAGSDTIVTGGSVAATEATNRKGTYTAAYTDIAAGTYRLTTADGLCVWWVDLLLATGTYQAYERTVQTGDSFARIGAAGAGLTAVGVATNADKTGYSLTATTGLGNQTANITGTITTATNLTNLPAITAGWLTAAGIAASALDGKGNWNIGKTGYSLTAGTGLGNQTADITGSLSGSVGSVTGAVGSVTGAVGSIGSGGITTASFAAGAINAAAIAGNAIGASELATDAVTEIANAVAAQITTDHGTGSYLTATGFSTHSAADVWTSATRTLTAFGFSVTVGTNSDKTGYSLTPTTGLGNQTADITGNLSGSVGSVSGAVGSVTAAVTVGAMNANVVTASALAADAVAEIQSGLSTLTAGQVNAEVLDVLQTDTFAELGAVPAATSSLKDKLTWLFMWFRNKSTETATQRKLYADDTTTVVSTEAVSDDGATFTKGEAS